MERLTKTSNSGEVAFTFNLYINCLPSEANKILNLATKLKEYEGKWKRVSLVQTSKDGSFNLRGEISYDIYDCFYDDGRIMKHGMYVGQERTKIGKTVFLTQSEAEAKLKDIM